MNKIRLGLFGHGNIARGIETTVGLFPDMEIAAVFSRRNPASVRSPFPVYGIDELSAFVGKIDVLMLCGGSLKDIPHYGPQAIELFHTVDAFDNHAKIPEYFALMNKAGKKSGKLGLISAGWDPGLFSIMRLLFESFLPSGAVYTFWGKGVSQGHSDAIRKIDGVADARQYTVPNSAAIESVRGGLCPLLSARDKHVRVCYVVPAEGADLFAIEKEIVTMPDYFADYDTSVIFVDIDTLNREHGGLPHGGVVLSSGETSPDLRHSLEFSLRLDSNPQFTSSVLLCGARAVWCLAAEGRCGAVSMLDVPPVYFSDKSPDFLRKSIL